MSIRPTDVAIRPVAAADLRQLACLIQYLAACHGEVSLATVDTLKRDLFGCAPSVRGFVAAQGPLLVGYALYYPVYNAQRAERGMDLTHLFVLADERRRGIGRALISAVEIEARSHACTFVAIGTHQHNAAAQAFYTHHFGEGAVSGPRYRVAV